MSLGVSRQGGHQQTQVAEYGPTPCERADTALAEQIDRIRSGTYGVPRIEADLLRVDVTTRGHKTPKRAVQARPPTARP